MKGRRTLVKNKGAFLIDIYDRQHGTWQGSVTWLDVNEKQHFRSALELIKLIDSALEEEGGSHEE